MIPKNIRKIPNPYFTTSSKLSSIEFVGRTEQVAKLHMILDDYQRTSNLQNIFISGEKSIGKSCLLNKYRQILQHYNFAVFETELQRNANIPIEEFEFFKVFFDELFEKYAPPEDNFFNEQQCEIWFSLTRDNYFHESDFQQRALSFPTQYANRKKGIEEVLSYKLLERDFEKILNELISKKMEFEGLAILIDEFQELSKSTLILDFLRQLSENLPGLIVIGAGLPTFYEEPVFEKFNRISLPVQLRNMGGGEIIDMIFKPMERLASRPRHDVQQWFDHRSLGEIVFRSGGNPLHIKILCWKMFEYYQNDASAELFKINKSVMEEVMEYYSNISEKSNRIRLSLQSCRRDQLDAFSLLYQYEGFSIRAAILLELAFKPLTSEEEERERDKITSAFDEIWDLRLFELKDSTLGLKDIIKMSVDGLAQVEYTFIGDAIDKLYSAYYYEELIGKTLTDNKGLSFEDILTHKLADQINSFLFSKRIPKDVVSSRPIVKIGSPGRDEKISGDNVVADLDDLIKASEESEKSSTKKDVLRKLSKKYRLGLPAHLASMLELKGYYLVIAEVEVKGKKRLIYNYIPVMAETDKVLELREQISPIFIEASALVQYMISVKFVYVYWMPLRPLMCITYVDLDRTSDELDESVKNRDFGKAVDLADRLDALTIKLSLTKKEIRGAIIHTNNYGFCLININCLPKAREILSLCEKGMLLSRVNLAYVAYLENDYVKAKQILKRIVKKNIGRDEDAGFLHLAVSHPNLPFENRLVEHVRAYNVAAWNLALIISQEGGEQSTIYSYLKRVKVQKDESLIDLRVRNWIHFFRGNVPTATEKAKELLNRCVKVEYLIRDVEKDIQIFSK